METPLRRRYELMEEGPEENGVIIDMLLREMESTVAAYGPGARQVPGASEIESERNKIGATRFVEGTSTFPVGIGLWRTDKPRGVRPVYFPRSPIMILGHNWGAIHELAGAHRRGTDGMRGPSWKCLLLYLDAANVDKMDCFFTNVIVGLQPHRAVGAMEVSDKFLSQCRAFLCKQIKIANPRLVATLGAFAADQYRLSGCPPEPIVNLLPVSKNWLPLPAGYPMDRKAPFLSQRIIVLGCQPRYSEMASQPSSLSSPVA